MPNVKTIGYSGAEFVHKDVSKVWLDAPESTEDNPVLVPFTYGEVLDGLEFDPDFSDGDISISMPDGYLAKSAVIKQPANLIPENIAEGVDIAGIIGAFAGGSSVKIATGTIGIKCTTGQRIEHGLGVKPDIVMFIGVDSGSCKTFNIGFSSEFSDKLGKKYMLYAFAQSSTARGWSQFSSVTIETTTASSGYIYKADADAFYIGASATYAINANSQWFAIAGLT